MSRVRLTLAVALLLSVAAPATVAAQETATRHEPATTIDWEPCKVAPGFDCARVTVPLDHDDPGGASIDLSVARLAATDQENKIGSIFLNPGGPGGSGTNFLFGAGPFLYSDEVRAHFDLVGFDPRGINRSRPLLCFDSLDEAFAGLPPFAFPMTPDEFTLEKAATEFLAAACGASRIRIRDHMSTADVARDMDLMRQMVGDEQLNYAGYSYGSFLGNTYVNMFPDKVRAVVIDGVLDPVDWTTGTGSEADTLPFSTRLGSSIGAQETLDEFFRLCDEAGPSACALAPDSSARFDALADKLLAGPIEIVDPFSGDVFPFTYADLIGSSLGPLYDSLSWPDHAAFLAFIEAGASPAVLGAALAATEAASGIRTFQARPRYPNFVEGFPGVACSDSDNPDNYEAWPIAAAADEAANGYFGRLWTHASAPCWNWPGASDDRYDGPFTTATSNPVLVVGTTYDPATPIHGAVSADAMLPNSSLLTVEGWGHTSLFLSACADAAVSDYLLTGVPPAAGTVCAQDFSPFGSPTAPAAIDGSATERAQLRSDVMDEIAFRPQR